MSRYKTLGPKCRHARQGIVTTHPHGYPAGGDESHAATDVCSRPSCIEDAIEWAWANSHRPAIYVEDVR